MTPLELSNAACAHHTGTCVSINRYLAILNDCVFSESYASVVQTNSTDIETHWSVAHTAAAISSAAVVGWSDEVLQPLWKAAASVPDDANVSFANMPEQDCYWFFEQPLAVQLYDDLAGITALLVQRSMNRFRVACFGWSEESHCTFQAQVLWSVEGEPITALLELIYNRRDISKLLGMSAADMNGHTRALFKFIVAAVAWLGTKYVSQDDVPPFRQLRKEAERRIGRKLEVVRVIHLRKAEHKDSVEGHEVAWSHRWLVEGHWRNQPHGSARTDRKLTWIAGYVKGPDDKPLVVKDKRYVVHR